MGGAIDLWMVYSFVRRLVTPFSEWEAYKLGIIDERGNVLKKRKELRRQEERRAFGVFDVLILNLKKLLERLPAGQTRLASYAAALWLIREQKAFTPDSLLTEDISDEQIQKSVTLFFNGYTDYTILKESVNKKMHSLDELFEQRFVDEDAPTNSVGAGAVSGLTADDEPGLTRAQQKKHRKRIMKRKPVILEKKNVVKYHVVELATRKVLASFQIKGLANRHYYVEKGWAEIITSDDSSISKGDIIR
jgi:hypothetical protein